jgi:predicted RNase H-like nuclease (RuvC/YqgF family)
MSFAATPAPKSPVNRSVPKLDLKKCENNDKTDYQAYSLKLEENLKELRAQIAKWEADNNELNLKYREQSRKLQEALQINKRLLQALGAQKDKYSSLKQRSKSSASSDGGSKMDMSYNPYS